MIEDLHTSYLDRYRAGSTKGGSTIEYLKQRIDDLNFNGKSVLDGGLPGIWGSPEVMQQKLAAEGIALSPLEEMIAGMSFYKSICFINKRGALAVSS